MVIGVEGNVHVGKTTYINEFFPNYILIKENIFKEKLNDYDRQINYINQEILRKKQLKENTIIDRTIISTVIYSMFSGIFNDKEKSNIKKIVESSMNKNLFIIPDFLYLVLYPYKLICENHHLLSAKKSTQNELVDYDYYLKYSLFFSKRYNCFINIKRTYDYRQIIVYNNNIFNNIFNKNIINSKVILDGCPAIGKTTIGMYQKKYKYIEEFKYKKYTIDDYSNQIDSIKNRIDILDKSNILLDTSFLMGLTHILYNTCVDKEKKLEIVDQIMSKVCLNKYITKIIYLTLDAKKIIERKENDKNKVRAHFNDNFNYLEKEYNFYKTIDKKLGILSNIHFIDASDSVKEISNHIIEIEDKPLLLIDLFYEIKEAIKKGEI